VSHSTANAGDPETAREERTARAHLSRVVEPGDPGLSGEVAEHGWLGVARRLWSGHGPPRWQARHKALTSSTAGLLRAVAKLGIHVTVPGDATWPLGLDDLEAADLGPVACLWVRGRLPHANGAADLSRRGVAIVGARACSSYGQHVATELACHLTAQGWTVVSGAAYGIDAGAHRGALAGHPGAGDARVATVAVMACGVDRAYPTAHADLLDRIVADGGAVISELPPGSAPQRWRFLQRNRVIAALTATTVVVEAASRSGAAGTARAAMALSRHVGAVPGPVTAVTSVGCHELIRDGIATLVRDVGDVIELSSPMGQGLLDVGPVDGPQAVPGAGLLPQRVVACLSSIDGMSTAQVALVAGLDVGHVRSILLDLEHTATVARQDGGWIRVGRRGRLGTS